MRSTIRRVCCASTRFMSMSRGCSERLADGASRDLAERHPSRLVLGDVRGLDDVPGDGLALTVEVGREVDGIGATGLLADRVDLLAAVLVDDVLGGEIVLDVHAELALAGVLGEVSDVPVAREHLCSPGRGTARSSAPSPATRRSPGSCVMSVECSTGSCALRRSVPVRRSLARPRVALIPSIGPL